MISELESIMSENDFNNKEWFPNFIILCKPISEGSGNMDNEWNGILREMEKVVKRQNEEANKHQNKITSGINDRIEKLSSEGKNST
jgi:gas vesicle protein